MTMAVAVAAGLGSSFPCQLPCPGNPLIDLGSTAEFAEYAPNLFGWSAGQVGVRLDPSNVQSVLARYANAADDGEIVRRTFIR